MSENDKLVHLIIKLVICVINLEMREGEEEGRMPYILLHNPDISSILFPLPWLLPLFPKAGSRFQVLPNLI
jgi:hypothetical protein